MEKKKLKRRVIGSVMRAKEGKGSYIKVREDVVLKQGESLRLESPKSQLESLDSAVAAGKLSGEMAEKVRERILKIPAYVLFEIVRLSE